MYMGSDTSWGGKSPTDWQSVKGSRHTLESLHAKDTGNTYWLYGVTRPQEWYYIRTIIFYDNQGYRNKILFKKNFTVIGL